MKDAKAGFVAYLEHLAFLRDSQAEYFLEGGQAVNFWAEYVNSRVKIRQLSSLRPFTSKDCDIWVSSNTWKSLKTNSSIKKGKSPADGQLGVQVLSKQPPRVLDILSSVFGIDEKEYPRLLARSLDDGTVRVIDPVFLFLSKCHCLLHLPQTDRQDEKHVRMLILILPAYITLLIADVEKGMISDRDLLKEIKLLKKISSSGICRRALKKFELSPASLIPWDRLASAEVKSLIKYSLSNQTNWKIT